tara:strand:+ start:1077 stop:1628 length:552 start_codon:yes stop_codon:yes gene_type:complete
MELIEISKKSTVPVLKTKSNKVIDESLEIMIWSIRNSNMHQLLGGNDNDKTKEIFSLIKTNDKIFKYHLDRFKYASKFNYRDLEAHRNAGIEILLSLNNRLKNSSKKGKTLFLFGEKETLADWAIWPFIRQFRIADIEKFDQNKEIQFLKNWLDYFFSHRKYPIVMKKNEYWDKKSQPLLFGQ